MVMMMSLITNMVIISITIRFVTMIVIAIMSALLMMFSFVIINYVRDRIRVWDCDRDRNRVRNSVRDSDYGCDYNLDYDYTCTCPHVSSSCFCTFSSSSTVSCLPASIELSCPLASWMRRAFSAFAWRSAYLLAATRTSSSCMRVFLSAVSFICITFLVFLSLCRKWQWIGFVLKVKFITKKRSIWI